MLRTARSRIILLLGALLVTLGVASQSPAGAAYFTPSAIEPLRQGHSGPRVTEMQQIVAAEGCSPGPIDGYFGPLTAAGLRCAEAQANVAQDAVYDSLTALAISGPITAAQPAQRIGSWGGTTGGVYSTAGSLAVLRSGGCNWLYGYLREAGLPIDTFMAISARESGCAVNGVYVVRRTDLSTSRFGLNFRGSMPRYWGSLCGVTDWTAPGRDVRVDVACAAAAYRALGLRPWAVS